MVSGESEERHWLMVLGRLVEKTVNLVHKMSILPQNIMFGTTGSHEQFKKCVKKILLIYIKHQQKDFDAFRSALTMEKGVFNF